MNMTAKNHHKSNYKNLYDQNLNQFSEGILIKNLSFLSTATQQEPYPKLQTVQNRTWMATPFWTAFEHIVS